MVHPLDPITDTEIHTASSLIKAESAPSRVQFVQLDRLDPPKSLALQYLDAERAGAKTLPKISRVMYCYYYKNLNVPLYKALVDVTSRKILFNEPMKDGVVGPVCPDLMRDAERAIYEHPRVQAEIAKLNLSSLSFDHPKLGKIGYKVVCEVWTYGRDSPNEKVPLCQAYMFLKLDHSEANHYSIPLKFSPVFEFLTHKFIRIDYLPSGADMKYIKDTLAHKVLPTVEYHPDVVYDDTERTDLKPLLLQQPEGPSFTIDGTKVEWQGWEFRVVTNQREGVVLYDVHFKGRSLFYRIALNEMTVPYGDGRAPFHRKQAFDLGDHGFGLSANSLQLGCHCLGVVKYLDGRRVDIDGASVLMPSIVCMHEQDYGLMYVHKNFRTGGSVATRRREFVVQLIATVSNYEYILNYIFDQAGAITVQVRATGILSTMAVEENTVVDFSTNVGPGVSAPYHQHLLSFRFDTRLDGDKNTAVYDDYVPMELHNELNPHGIGFVGKRTFVEKSGYIEQSPFTNRTYKVINEASINPVTLKPVAYKFEMPARQMAIAADTSFNIKRAKYATKQFWVTKYKDNQLYAAGEFTNQSHADSGIVHWANGEDTVRNEDIVVWPTLALTHAPVTEQFPVMASDFMQFVVTPASFFNKNPAMDIPQANNNFNKSVYFEDSGADLKPECCKGNI